MQSSQPKLQDLIGDHLTLVGVTGRQMGRACSRFRTTEWARLPLYTDAKLGGHALQQFLMPKLSVSSFDKFCWIYDEFVEGFVTTNTYKYRHGALTWLRAELGLEKEMANYLFSESTKSRPGKVNTNRALFLDLVSLAAIAAQVFHAVVVKHTPDTFIVRSGLRYFGIDRGCPVRTAYSGYTPAGEIVGKRLAQIRNSKGLTHAGRGHVVAREDSDASLYGMLLAVMQDNPYLLAGEDPKAWVEAISIMRYLNPKVPNSLANLIPPGFTGDQLKQAVRLCAGFRSTPAPYRHLREILVPVYMPFEDFKQHFGHPLAGNLTTQRALQWDMALDNIIENFKEENFA